MGTLTTVADLPMSLLDNLRELGSLQSHTLAEGKRLKINYLLEQFQIVWSTLATWLAVEASGGWEWGGVLISRNINSNRILNAPFLLLASYSPFLGVSITTTPEVGLEG